MKLLCAADLHLGRQPSRIGGPVRVLADELSATVAWRGLVASAIALEVTAVLLAGDVLDDEHDYFEAYGDLRAGVEELVAAGIGVFAVSGNHDVEVLPRLARAVPSLVLLGEGGRWEAHTLASESATVHLVGWSYPTSSVTHSPLATLSAALDSLSPATVVGLLHCDRDQSASAYAPVTSAALAAAGPDVWLLGHVHKPDIGSFAGAGGEAAPAAYLSGYLGSTFAADPGEEGGRGAWLLEVDGERTTIEPLQLSPLRFETLDIDTGALESVDGLAQLITDQITELHTRLAEDAARAHVVPAPGAVTAVGVRLRLTGRSAWRSEIAQSLEEDDPRDLLLTLDGVAYFVHAVRLEVMPAIDIAAAALGSDPLALMARKLLVLDGPPSEELNRLLDQGREQLARAGAGRHYRELAPPALDDEAVHGRLRRSALRLIDLMAPE